MPRTTIIVLILAALAWGQVGQAPGAAAQAGCSFKLGFKALRDQIPEVVGDCLEDEHLDPLSGNVEQRTTKGVLVWRKADNWTAFTDAQTTWISGPEGLQSRSNGESFIWEKAPGPGTARTESGREIPNRYIHRVVEAPREDSKLACLAENPSCSRDDWWVEWNELQSDDAVQYRFVGPGLVTEARFVEAIWLIWKWPEGQELLRSAADHGVMILSHPSASEAIAYYTHAVRAIVLNPRFEEASTWMVADVLAHELRHAADHRSGQRAVGTYDNCIAAEQAAYQTERRFLVWIVERFEGIPAPQRVADTLSPDDHTLYSNLFGIAAAPDVDAKALEDYRQNCARFK
jgi:hypothetical protein